MAEPFGRPERESGATGSKNHELPARPPNHPLRDCESSPIIDLETVRDDTPGCVGSRPRIHLNNAGASFVPKIVLQTITEHLVFEQEIGGYEAAKEKQDAVRQTYRNIAMLIGADASEISCVENATRAFDLAFYSLVYGTPLKPVTAKSILVTSSTEYGSNQLALQQVASRFGANVHCLPADEHGYISLNALRSLLVKEKQNIFLVSLTWIPTNGGIVQPASAVGDICREFSVPFLLDACQAVGQMDVDVRDLKCDAMFATGRKFLRGPRGIGFLYVRGGNDSPFSGVEPIFIDIWSARLHCGGKGYDISRGGSRFEAWEKPVALWLGLGAAVKYALDVGITVIEARVKHLGHVLRRHLASIETVSIRDLGVSEGQCGIVSFSMEHVDANAVQEFLSQVGINVSVTSKWSTLQDMEERCIDSLVRASVHYYNTEDELGVFAACVQDIARRDNLIPVVEGEEVADGAL